MVISNVQQKFESNSKVSTLSPDVPSPSTDARTPQAKQQHLSPAGTKVLTTHDQRDGVYTYIWLSRPHDGNIVYTKRVSVGNAKMNGTPADYYFPWLKKS